MKKIALIGLLACLMTGCHINLNGETKWTYEHPDRYQTGDAVVGQAISDIDIKWLEGNIDFVYGDSPELRISEESTANLDDSLRMRWYVDDESCLKIQFCQSGTYKTNRLNNLGKHLTITVPRNLPLDEIEVDAVSSDVRIDSVVCCKLKLECVKVNLNASYPTLPDELNIDGVNCKLNLHVAQGAGMTIKMDGVNSDLYSSLPSKKDGRKTILGNGKCEVDIDAVNCTLNVNEL